MTKNAQPCICNLHTETRTCTGILTGLAGHLSDGKDATNAAVLGGFLALHMLASTCYQGGCDRMHLLLGRWYFAISAYWFKRPTHINRAISHNTTPGLATTNSNWTNSPLPPSPRYLVSIDHCMAGTCSIWGASATHGVTGAVLAADEVAAGRALGSRATIVAIGTRPLRNTSRPNV